MSLRRLKQIAGTLLPRKSHSTYNEQQADAQTPLGSVNRLLDMLVSPIQDP